MTNTVIGIFIAIALVVLLVVAWHQIKKTFEE